MYFYFVSYIIKMKIYFIYIKIYFISNDYIIIYNSYITIEIYVYWVDMLLNFYNETILNNIFL